MIRPGARDIARTRSAAGRDSDCGEARRKGARPQARVKASCSSAMPLSGNMPRDWVGRPALAAMRWSKTIGVSSSWVRPSSRVARLTAGPMTVKSRRESSPTNFGSYV